jgi:ubiquitin thioesterase protein OTUB1
MQNKEPVLDDGEVEYEAGPESAWGNFEDDDDVMQQQSSIQDDEAKKFPFVGDKVRP